MMMNDCLALVWLESVIVGVVLVVSLVGFLMSRRMRAKPAPRDQRKLSYWVGWVFLAIGLLQLTLTIVEGSSPRLTRVLMIGNFVVAGGIFLYQSSRRRSEQEVQANYAHDQRLCGQCDYDLTGNVTGVCSECGWRIPDEPVRLVSPMWNKWWKRWDIEYLDRWRLRLSAAIGGTIMSAALAVVFWGWLGRVGSLLAILMMLVVVHGTITAIRIYQYGRREKAKERGTAEKGEA
jgi:hypothetical protein